MTPKRTKKKPPRAAEVAIFRELEAMCREAFLRGPLVCPSIVELLHRLSDERKEPRERGKWERG